MNYGSVCSGIEAATIAWHPLGWTPAWFAEIDPFCCALLKHHYPEVPNLGDFTKIGADSARTEYAGIDSEPSFLSSARHAELRDSDDARIASMRNVCEPIDVLVGGTPCQDFSVAGLRAGMDGARGLLTFQFYELAYRLRPPWFLWENVPGVFSLDKGRVFGLILARAAGYPTGTLFEPPANGWGNAGVIEQANSRSFGIAWRVLDAQHFGVPQRRRRVFVVGHLGDWQRAAAVLFERASLSGNPAPSRAKREDVALPIGTRVDRGGSHREAEGNNLVANPLMQKTGRLQIEETLVAPTLDAHYGEKWGLDDQHINSGPAFTLDRTTQAVATFDERNITSKGNRSRVEYGAPCHSLHTTGAGIVGSGVRRLTPRECERLQGFPDDYTAIPYRGKPASDGPRYRALGNSMAVPVMRWIGQRIQQIDELTLLGVADGEVAAAGSAQGRVVVPAN